MDLFSGDIKYAHATHPKKNRHILSHGVYYITLNPKDLYRKFIINVDYY